MDSVFLKACRLEKTPSTPIWLMRQAGRYMKEYRALREKTPFLELCKNKDLVTEVTVSAQEKIKADAAIIFSDILLIVEPFGLGLDYLKGDGPSIQRTVRTAKDVEQIPEIEPKASLSFVFQGIRQTRAALKPDIPLTGFAGAPFTLASYMIEGGASKDLKKTRELMLSDHPAWNALLEKISRATVSYLNAQIEAGAGAVQLFDSWAGCLSPEEYKTFVFPFSKKVFDGVGNRVPAIHFGTGTKNFLEFMAHAGGDVISVDHNISLREAWQKIGPGKAIQGNLDPKVLCGSLGDIKKEVKRILAEAQGRPGHIFNLGHGVLPETPVENVIALVDMVHELSRVGFETHPYKGRVND